MQIPIVNRSPHSLPQYATPHSAGVDLCAWLEEPLVLTPGARALVPTGISVAIPSGYEGQVRPRSGLALKKGITVLNAPGTIDADYRGEIGVVLINLGQEPVEIYSGDRIAQLIIARYERFDWQEVDQLDTTMRGEGGFGHTGEKTLS